MADFKTHIATSTILGVGYATGAHLIYNVPLESSILAGGLCSVSGMLPDIDSDSGIPLRESMAFASAIVPMLMIGRLQALGMSHESIVLAGAVIYCIVRFGVAEVIRRTTVHRGMFHSIPACAIAGLMAFLLCCDEDVSLRIFKASGVVVGFMSHLALDEIWSVKLGMTGVKLKKSFGTAIKFWGDTGWANFATYGAVFFLSVLALGDPLFMEQFHQHAPGTVDHAPKTAQQIWTDALNAGKKLVR